MKALVHKFAEGCDGEDSESWQRVQQRWEQVTTELHQIIQATQQALGKAADNHQAAEKKNVGM
nr:hypothetical protein [Streptomyces sp. L2]